MTNTPPMRKVVCPHCGHEQEEPFGAISTYCHACKQHVPIRPLQRRRVAVVPQNTRVVICRECGYVDKIVADAQSTQCENCSTYLDLRNYTVKEKSNQKLCTYGDVTFLPGCHYEGPPVRGGKIVVGGKVSAIIQADTELEIQEHGKVNNPISAPIIRITKGADVRVTQIHTRCLELGAKIHLEEVEASEQIVILPSGQLIAQRVSTRFIDVQPGGVLLAELDVEPGTIDLELPAASAKEEDTENAEA